VRGKVVKEPLLWDELASSDIPDIVKKTKMVIIPVCSIEQHGPHLPLCFDVLEGLAICHRISAETGVPVMPPIVYGCSNAHGKFPGTVSIRPETMSRMIKEICSSLYHVSGIRKFVIINSHMGNAGPILSAVDDLKFELPEIQIRALNWWELATEAWKLYTVDSPWGKAHGNLAETSLTLALRPDLVRMERAVNEPEKPYFFSYRLDQISLSGVIGADAKSATAEFGDRLIKIAVQELTPYIKKAISEETPIKKTTSKEEKA
jgi:creatinine amidohydrolase